MTLQYNLNVKINIVKGLEQLVWTLTKKTTEVNNVNVDMSNPTIAVTNPQIKVQNQNLCIYPNIQIPEINSYSTIQLQQPQINFQPNLSFNTPTIQISQPQIIINPQVNPQVLVKPEIKIQIPKIQMPKIQFQNFQLPKIQILKLQLPKFDLPINQNHFNPSINITPEIKQPHIINNTKNQIVVDFSALEKLLKILTQKILQPKLKICKNVINHSNLKTIKTTLGCNTNTVLQITNKQRGTLTNKIHKKNSHTQTNFLPRKTTQNDQIIVQPKIIFKPKLTIKTQKLQRSIKNTRHRDRDNARIKYVGKKICKKKKYVQKYHNPKKIKYIEKQQDVKYIGKKQRIKYIQKSQQKSVQTESYVIQSQQQKCNKKFIQTSAQNKLTKSERNSVIQKMENTMQKMKKFSGYLFDPEPVKEIIEEIKRGRLGREQINCIMESFQFINYGNWYQDVEEQEWNEPSEQGEEISEQQIDEE